MIGGYRCLQHSALVHASRPGGVMISTEFLQRYVSGSNLALEEIFFGYNAGLH